MAQPKDFGFGSDEQMMRDQARRFLRDQAGIEKLRALVARDHKESYESAVQPAPWDRALWDQAVALGWTALAVSAEAGGAGMPMVAVAALAEEAGRAALPSPLIATLCATAVVSAAQTEGAARLLGRIAEGATAALAICGNDSAWDLGNTEVSAKAAGSGFVLQGTSYFVQDARKVTDFVVAARAENGVALLRVAADAPGLTIRPDRIVDLTRDQAALVFSGVEVRAEDVIAAPGDGEAVLAAALPAILTIVAADICGAGEWQLQTTTEYARTRKQFDHALGFFQAVKHPLVNMMVDLDRARSLVYAAACAIDHEPAQAERLARMAKAAASDAAAFLSSRSVQLHGGIGFTWECDVHIWFKRQKHNQALYGDANWQRAKLAESFADV